MIKIKKKIKQRKKGRKPAQHEKGTRAGPIKDSISEIEKEAADSTSRSAARFWAVLPAHTGSAAFGRGRV